MPSAEAIRAAFAEISADSPVELHLGAENFWDEVFFERWRTGTIPAYDQTRAFLFEIPVGEVPLRLEETLFAMATRGLLPVMAHPERYVVPWDRLAHLSESFPMVVDLGAVSGYHGARPGKIAQKLVLDRIAHAAATDVHSVADIRPALEGIAWIRKKLGEAAVTRLCDENPRRILCGELPEH